MSRDPEARLVEAAYALSAGGGISVAKMAGPKGCSRSGRLGGDRPWRLVVWFSAVAAAWVAILPGLALGEPEPPSLDPFYVTPAPLASYQPGAIVRSRAVNVELQGIPLSALHARAYQLLYRTNNAFGDPVATVTTAIVPDGPAPAHGRQLVSVQDAENSDSETCAPSYQLQIGEPNSFAGVELTGVLSELVAGRVLVIPDALGPSSEFLVTGMEGHATLDSIRAVERFAPAELEGARTPVGLIGYSEGAHQTMAAAELAPGYAPNVNIVGVAAGGVPVGDVETLSYLAESDPSNVLQVMTGINRAFSQLEWPSLLNASGRAASQTMSTCSLVELLAGPSGPLSEWTTVPNVFSVPRVAKVLATNALGHATPAAPSYVFIGAQDEEISKDALDKLVSRYCANGAKIDYYADPDGNEHFQSAALFFPLGDDYLNARFSGKPAPDTCPARRYGTARLRGRRLHINRRRVPVVLDCTGSSGSLCQATISIIARAGRRHPHAAPNAVCGTASYRASAPHTTKLKILLSSRCTLRADKARHRELAATLVARFSSHQTGLREPVRLIA